MYKTVITQDIYKINAKNMKPCYNKFINLYQHENMYERVVVVALSGTFNAISGANVYNMTLTLPLSEG